MASSQVFYMAEKTCLEICCLGQTVCLCLHGPRVTLFIDTLNNGKHPAQPDNWSLNKKTCHASKNIMAENVV